MSDMLTLLVDTNVWLDHYLARGAQGSAATGLLLAAVQNPAVELAYSSMAAKDVFFIMAKVLKDELRESGATVTEAAAKAAHAVAWGCVDNMAELAIAVPSDETDLWLARKSRSEQEDLEDAIIVAAARRVRADYLVTGDKQLLRQIPALAVTPQDMLAKLPGIADG